MARLPKFRYSLVLLILITILAGCELRREESELSDPGPVSDLPPTLAPLGAETDLVAEATPIPTIINIQPGDAAQGATNESLTVERSTEVVVTASEQQVLGAPVVSGDAIEEASSTAAENSEEIAPHAESAVADETAVVEEAIVVDATTSDELPIGGPVAANPPASQTTGSYDVSGTTYTDASYTVQQGDTLFSIAVRYGTSVDAIILVNGLSSDVIYAGQALNIPDANSGYTDPTYQQQPATYDNTGQGGQHVVAPGDTLYSIALRYGTSVDAIAGTNGIPYPYFIQVGQALALPSPGDYFGPPPPAPAAGFYEQPVYEQPYQEYPAQTENYAPVPGNAGTHTVAPGETLFSISLRYGTSAETLAAANGLYNPNQIYVGQVLYLP